uniref:Homeobox domain-containing protein n=1 Tax=Parascaris univalens TaxID=6257 RepID=A0A915B2E8_PARUN
MSMKPEEADADIKEFMEFFKSSPSFCPHNVKQIDTDSQFRSARSSQQITAGSCITSSSCNSIPAAYHRQEASLSTATIDRSVAEGIAVITPHNIHNGAIAPISPYPTAPLSQSPGILSSGETILKMMGKKADIKNASRNVSLAFDTSQNIEQMRLREFLQSSSEVYNEAMFNVAGTRDYTLDGTLLTSTIGEIGDHREEMRLSSSTDKKGFHEGTKDAANGILRFAEGGICERDCMEVGANEVVSQLSLQHNVISSYSDKTNEPQGANLSSQPTVTPDGASTHIRRSANPASNYPVVCAVPVSQLQLTAPTVQAAYTPSTVPVMPALMRTSVQLLSLVPGSLLRCSSSMIDNQLQPLNLSRDVYARPFYQPAPTFPVATAETPCNNPHRTCSGGQPAETSDSVNGIKERLSLEGKNVRSQSTFDLHSSASPFPSIVNCQTRKDPVECLTQRKLPEAKTSALKRQVAPNITVRTLPLGTVIVRRKAERMSKYMRAGKVSQPRSLRMSSPLTPPQSLIEESVDADREKVVRKYLEMLRSDDSSSWNRSIKYENYIDKNNNGAANSENERSVTSKKRRQRLSNAQKLALEEHFERNRYPSKQTIEALCETSGLEVVEVRRWFVNRRRRERARVKLQHEVTPPSISPPSSESQDSRNENYIKKVIID